jgi:hypothetical protein
MTTDQHEPGDVSAPALSPTEVTDHMLYRRATDLEPNVAVIQETLATVTARLGRWDQANWCRVPGRVDRLRASDLDAGVYHDFELDAETVAYLRQEYENFRSLPIRLPIADCGTSFCVAGDVAVRHGWTFVGHAGEATSEQVMPTDAINPFLRGEVTPVHNVSRVAATILGLSGADAHMLFSGNNGLLDIWAIGHAVTGGQLVLPDELPDTSYTNASVRSPAIIGRDEVRDAVQFVRGYVTYVHSRTDWLSRNRGFDIEAFRRVATDRDRVKALGYVFGAELDRMFTWIETESELLPHR